MPPRKTQTIKDVMKESQSIIDQKLGATRSKKVKKNESDEESDYITTSSKSKQKNSNTSSKVKSSVNKQKESINQSKDDDPQDKLSPELKPSSQRQKARTKGEKMQEKNSTKTEDIKTKQQNEDENKNLDNEGQNTKESIQQVSQIDEENKNKDINNKDNDNNDINNKDNNNINQQIINSNDNQDNLNNKEQEPHKQQDNNHNIQDNNNNNNQELLNKENNQEQQQIQTDNNTLQNNIKESKNKENHEEKHTIPIVNNNEEEEKEQLEKQLQVDQSIQNLDIVFCCDIHILQGRSVEQLKNTIEFIIQQLKEKEHFNFSIKFSLVSFNDIIINQKLQQCQIIDLCDDTEILQSLEEIKQIGQIEIKKGLYYGLKLATQNTKWRKQSNNKSYRYIIHIANQQLELDNQSDELEHIIQEMNNKNIRYKYLRIDKRIDLDFDGKQYLQNKLNSYEESFLKEFGCLKNVVSSIILRELIYENNK